jgi:hypothetical protein
MGSAQAAKPSFPLRYPLYVKPAQEAQANQADEDQVDRHNEIEQSRHDQDQGNDCRHMRSGDGHSKAPIDVVENRIEGGSLAATAFSREVDSGFA